MNDSLIGKGLVVALAAGGLHAPVLYCRAQDLAAQCIPHEHIEQQPGGHGGLGTRVVAVVSSASTGVSVISMPSAI